MRNTGGLPARRLTWCCLLRALPKPAGFLLLFGNCGTATPAPVNLTGSRTPQTGGAVAFRSQAALFRTEPVPRRFPRALDRRFRHGGVSIRGTRGVLIGGRRAWVGRRETADSRLGATIAAAATSVTMDDADAAKIIDGESPRSESKSFRGIKCILPYLQNSWLVCFFLDKGLPLALSVILTLTVTIILSARWYPGYPPRQSIRPWFGRNA